MKKALLAVLFSAFLPSLAMADHHRTSIGLSFGFGNSYSYCRGYDYGYYAPASYYSYSYYPAYTTYAYPPPPVYVAPPPVYVAPPRIYVEPAPRVYFYESRYRDYGGRHYDDDRHYRRY